MAIIFGNSNGGGGGGGSTVNTANLISGDGSVGTPVVLGGNAANQNNNLDITGFQFSLNGPNVVAEVSDSGQSILLDCVNIVDDSEATLSLSGGGTASLEAADSAGDPIGMSIEANGAGILIFDQVFNQGIANQFDYSSNTNPLRLVQLNELGGSEVASSKVAGESATQALVTYAIPTSTTTQYRVTMSLVGVTGIGTVQASVAWTDTQGNAQTKNIGGSTTGGVDNGASPLDIFCLNGTNIVLTATVTGTIIYDAAALIQFLQ